MNFLFAIPLFSGILVLIAANLVYHSNKTNPVNKYFAVLTLILAYSAIIEFLCYQSANEKIAYMWIKAGFLWYFHPAVLVHFSLVFSKQSKFLKNRFFIIVNYAPAFFFSSLALFTDLLNAKPVHTAIGYTYRRLPENPIYFKIFFSWMLLSGIIALGLCLFYFFKTNCRNEKMKIKYLFIGFLFPVIGTFAEKLFMPGQILFFHTASLIFAACFIGFGIIKHQLFLINPETAADKIVDAMKDGLLLLDLNGDVIYANNSFLKIFRLTASDVINKNIKMLFNGFCDAEIIKQILRGDEINKNLCLFKDQNNEKKYLELSNSFLTVKNREKIGIICILSDITEKKAAEVKIQETQAMLLHSEKMAAIGQLAGGVAHEINNPMAVILGFSQSIAKKINEDDPLYMPLKSIEREAIRCKKMIGDLLTFSRSGKTEKEKADLNELINQTLSLIEAQTKVRNTEIIRVFAAGLPLLIINKNQIQQVIVNLCNNALDAMPDGGKITISTEQAGNEILIKISDTGTGMTEEIRKHIFEPFFTTKEAGKGTGLGLSLCYEIIQKHNGSITAESKTGMGTTFVIKLSLK